MAIDIRSEARAVVQGLQRIFKPAGVPEVGTVVAVERAENQRAELAIVRLAAGSQDVKVRLYGPDVAEGQAVWIERQVGRPAGAEWTFVGWADSNTPFPSSEADLRIPAPEWGAPALDSDPLPAGPGGQMATVVAIVIETPEGYGPRETELRWRVGASGPWHEELKANQANVDAAHTFRFGPVPLGATVNAQARTRTHGRSVSDWSELRSHTVTLDETRPPAPAMGPPDLSLNLTAKFTFPRPSMPEAFSHWELAVAGDGAGGPGSFGGVLPRTYQVYASQHLVTLPQAGPIFFRAREVTQSLARTGGGGDWFPANGWSGPWNVVQNDAVVDTTPPPAPTLASAAADVTFDVNGDLNIIITVQLGPYNPPGDFRYFALHAWNGSVWEPERYSATGPFQVDRARPGVTYLLKAQAIDAAGNRSGFSNQLSAPTPSVQQPPKPGSPPTARPAPSALVVSWVPIAATTATGPIAQYDLQWSTDGVNWTTIAGQRNTSYVHAGLNPAVTYFYRYRAWNSNGSGGVPGPYSDPSLGYRPNPLSNVDFAANQIDANIVIAHQSITAPLLQADLVLASTIRALGAGGVAGRIFAGTSVLLNGLGVTINSANALLFRKGALETGEIVAQFGPVANLQGLGDGVLLHQPNNGLTNSGALFIASNRRGSGLNFLSYLTDTGFRTWAAGVGHGAGVDIFGHFMSDGAAGALYRHGLTFSYGGPVGHLNAWQRSGTYNLPTRATALHCRISNTGSQMLWLSESTSDRERGIFVLPGHTVMGNVGFDAFSNTYWHVDGGGSGSVVIYTLGFYM